MYQHCQKVQYNNGSQTSSNNFQVSINVATLGWQHQPNCTVESWHCRCREQSANQWFCASGCTLQHSEWLLKYFLWVKAWFIKFGSLILVHSVASHHQDFPNIWITRVLLKVQISNPFCWRYWFTNRERRQEFVFLRRTEVILMFSLHLGNC